MKEPKVVELKKYINAILKMKKKYVNADRLSKVVGVYPEIITETLSYFEPTLMMDPDYNLLDLVTVMKEFIIKKEEEKAVIQEKRIIVKKKEIAMYDSVGDFVYKKMTIAGGLLDKNANLTDKDLEALKKLINEELRKRKNK